VEAAIPLRREQLLRGLADAKLNVAESQKRLASQRERVGELERIGWDATVSRALLDTFAATPQSHLHFLQTIQHELFGGRHGDAAVRWKPR
jgi:hypothetical protein